MGTFNGCMGTIFITGVFAHKSDFLVKIGSVSHHFKRFTGIFFEFATAFSSAMGNDTEWSGDQGNSSSCNFLSFLSLVTLSSPKGCRRPKCKIIVNVSFNGVGN